MHDMIDRIVVSKFILFVSISHNTIADDAVRKRHQRQDEILIILFLPALYWNQQFFFSVTYAFLAVWNARIYSKRASVCCANWTGLFKCRGRIYCVTIFLKTNFGWSAGKNNADLRPLLRYFFVYVLGVSFCYWEI